MTPDLRLTITRMFWQSSSQNHFRIVTSPNGINSQSFQTPPSGVCHCGRDPFNQNSNRSDREKRTTSKGGPVFSKLFRLDRTDPLSFGPKFPEILVEWIAPCISISPFINKSEASYFFMWIYLEMFKPRRTQGRYFHPQHLSSKWLSYRHSILGIECISCLVKYKYRLGYHMHFLLHRGRRHRFLLCIN